MRHTQLKVSCLGMAAGQDFLFMFIQHVVLCVQSCWTNLLMGRSCQDLLWCRVTWLTLALPLWLLLLIVPCT